MPHTRPSTFLRSAAGVLAICAWIGCKKEAPAGARDRAASAGNRRAPPGR